MENKSHLEENRPLLSICIPTYNRASYLKGALEHISSDPAFDARVEVVVSDNASSDDTEIVVKAFTEKYGNIRYYRNAENVRDANFKLVLERATGRYLKLFNDTLRFKADGLSKILDVISAADESQGLQFYQNISFLSSENRAVEGVEELMSAVSYNITWIGNFGIWRSELDFLDVDDRYVRMQLAQVAWLLNMAGEKAIRIEFGIWYDPLWPKNKGGYNFFRVFIINYFEILSDYGLKGRCFSVEKYRLFRHCLLHYIYKFLLRNKKERFDTTGAWRILRKYYGREFYAYILFLMFGVKRLVENVGWAIKEGFR